MVLYINYRIKVFRVGKSSRNTVLMNAAIHNPSLHEILNKIRFRGIDVASRTTVNRYLQSLVPLLDDLTMDGETWDSLTIWGIPHTNVPQ
jgi:hypothetical protein